MSAERDGESRHAEAAFSEAGAVSPRRGIVHRALGRARRPARVIARGLAVLPEGLSTLRKVTVDLGAVALVAVAVGYFISALNRETIVIEVPSVPAALQDRGITPQLLTHLLQAKVQEIYAAPETPAEPAAGPVPPPIPAELIQAQIDAIYGSYDVPVTPEDATAADAPVPRRGGHVGMSLAGSVAAATDDSIGLITDEINRALETTRIAEMAAPPTPPLVVTTAGFNLSVDSLAQAARRLLGIEAQRRLMVSLLCSPAGCSEDAVTLHAVAVAGEAVYSEAVPLQAEGLDTAVAAAADFAMRYYDPQVLAAHYYRQGEFAAARRVAAAMSAQPSADAGWAESLLGLVALRAGDYAAAERHLTTALEINPDDFQARVNLGVVHFRSGDFPAAERVFGEALASQPGHSVALVNLGNTLLRLCDWDGAAQAYQQALATDPDSAPARFSLDLVKSIPQLKAYLLDKAAERAPVALSGESPAVREPAWRSFAEVLDAAAFCAGLANKDF